MYSTDRPEFKLNMDYFLLHAQNDGIKDILKEFIEDSINLVNQKFQKIEQEYQRISKENDEEAQIYYQHDYEPRRITSIELKESIVNCGIGFLFSQFEVKFFELASIVKEKFHGIEINDYKNKCKRNNKGINLARSYIIDTSEINISDLEKDWFKIKQFQNLRHCLIHRNGLVMKEQSIIDMAKNNPNINHHIESDKIFANKIYLFETSELVFDYLFKTMERLTQKTEKQ
jgi:hypothetical protein